jgi:hypothetical protein
MNDNYQNYEIVGSYFTAGEDTPMYLATRMDDKEHSAIGVWKVNPKPYDTLKKGKTWPMQIKLTFEKDGKEFFLTSPHYNKKLGKDVSTAFVRGDHTISTVNKDIVHGSGSSYYVPPTENIFEKLGGNIKLLVVLGLAAWVGSSYFKGRRK